MKTTGKSRLFFWLMTWMILICASFVFSGNLSRADIGSMIQNLYSRGIIDSLPRGSRDTLTILDRFEYAKLMKNLMEKIESGELRVSNLSTTEIENIETLVEEFSDEIVQILSRKNIHSPLKKAEQKNIAMWNEPSEKEEAPLYREEEEDDLPRTFDLPQWNDRWAVYLGASLYGPKSLGQYVNNSMKQDSKYTSRELGPSLGLCYGISNRWVLDVRGEWMNDDVDITDSTGKDNYLGDVIRGNTTYTKALDLRYKINPFTATISYYMEEYRKFRPFIGIGAGVYNTKISMDEFKNTARGEANRILTASMEKTIPCFVAQAGGEYWFDKRFYLKGDIRVINGDHTFQTAEDSALSIGAGLLADDATATEVTARTALRNQVIANSLSDDLKIDMSDVSFHAALSYLFD